MIDLPQGMGRQDKQVTLRYGTHASYLKYAELIHVELSEQIQAGHMDVYPLDTVMDLHKLWLSPIAVITQVGRRPHLIFYFTRSGLN